MLLFHCFRYQELSSSRKEKEKKSENGKEKRKKKKKKEKERPKPELRRGCYHPIPSFPNAFCASLTQEQPRFSKKHPLMKRLYRFLGFFWGFFLSQVRTLSAGLISVWFFLEEVQKGFKKINKNQIFIF